jgi:hypothetical protein
LLEVGVAPESIDASWPGDASGIVVDVAPQELLDFRTLPLLTDITKPPVLVPILVLAIFADFCKLQAPSAGVIVVVHISRVVKGEVVGSRKKALHHGFGGRGIEVGGRHTVPIWRVFRVDGTSSFEMAP